MAERDVKFTKGQWEAREYRVFARIETEPRIVAYARGLNNRERTPEDLANARLISAAPELYEACKGLASELLETILGVCPNDCHHSECQILKLARAAIAKAEGAQ